MKPFLKPVSKQSIEEVSQSLWMLQNQWYNPNVAGTYTMEQANRKLRAMRMRNDLPPALRNQINKFQSELIQPSRVAKNKKSGKPISCAIMQLR